MTLPPTAYTSLPISSLLIPLDPTHQLHHPSYNDCPNGWDFDDNINNDNTTTNIFAYDDIFAHDDSQSVRWGFDNKFIFDLKGKIITDNVMDAIESIVFDNKLDREFVDDINDPETESIPDTSSIYFPSSDDSLVASSYKLQRRTCQKVCRTNDCTILPTKIYKSHPVNSNFLDRHHR